MRLVILDETLKECRRTYEEGGSGGNIIGRILDTDEEGHIYVAALRISASGWYGQYQWIGRWEMRDRPASEQPPTGEYLQLFLSPDGDDMSAFYKGHKIEDIHIANYSTDFSARIAGIVDCEALAGKMVFIIGAGSAGSQIGMHLVRAGVGRYTLVDFDTVEAANLCRCEYSVEDIGRYKTLALRDRLLGINPFVQVETHQRNVMQMDDEELLGIIEDSDLVMGAADDPSAEHRVNTLAHSLAPVIYPGLYSRASGGEVIFTVPGGPCYQCVIGSLRSVSDAPSRGEWDYTTAGDLKAEPGLGIDISHTVIIASKVALGLLMSHMEDSDVAGVIDSRRTLALVSNGTQELYGIPFEPMGILWAETEVNENCEICRVRGEDHDALLAQVRARVAAAAVMDLPGDSETGEDEDKR